MPIPEEETHLTSQNKYRAQLAALLGGRVAEELRFGDVTTGASNDLERVTDMARSMVTQWGMSERMGPIQYGERDEMIFLGRSLGESRNYSDKVAQEIDEEVRKLVDDAYQETHRILTEQRDKLDAVAMRLLEIETLHAPEFEAIMRGEQIVERKPSEQPAANRPGRAQSGLSDDERSKREGEGRDKGLDLGGTVPAPA